MSSIDDEFHANKSERFKSFEKTVENIFDEKLSKFGDCFRKAKKKKKKTITHVQILNNYGRYYLIKVHGSFKNVLQQFNIDGHNHKNIRKLKTLHKDIKFKIFLYYIQYILFRTISLKNSKNLVYKLDEDLKNLVDEEELIHYINSTFPFFRSQSL